MGIQINREAVAKLVRPLWEFAKIFGRHGVAVGVSTGLALALCIAGCLFMVAMWFALLVAAILSNGDLGGPLFLPLSFIVFFLCFLASLGVILLILLPSVLLAEFVSELAPLAWRYPLQAVLCVLFALPGALWFSNLLPHGDGAGWLQRWVLMWALLLVPLGLYWWVAKAVEAGMTLGKILTFSGLKLAGAILRHGPRAQLALDGKA